MSNNTKTGLQKFNSYITNPVADDYLGNVLGNRKEQFVTNIVSVVSNSDLLQDCQPNTIMYAAIKATSLGLSLDSNLGLAYMVPYNNTKKKVKEAQLQIGYKGFIQLAIRSGQFQTINYSDVREGEIKSENRLTGEIIFDWEQDRSKREALKVIGFIAYYKLNNGFEKMSFMTTEEAEAHGKKYSQSFKSTKKYIVESSLWTTNFDFMAKKTVLKLLLSKFAPLSTEMQTAIKYDQAVIRSNEDVTYIDNDTEDVEHLDFDAIEKEILEAIDVLTLDDEDRLHIEMVIGQKDTDSYLEIVTELRLKMKKSEMKEKGTKLNLP